MARPGLDNGGLRLVGSLGVRRVLGAAGAVSSGQIFWAAIDLTFDRIAQKE